jgi:hypothetical protein
VDVTGGRGSETDADLVARGSGFWRHIKMVAERQVWIVVGAVALH